MSELSKVQKILYIGAAFTLAACSAVEAEPGADAGGAPPVDRNPISLVETPPTVTWPSGEISLEPQIITDSIAIEPVEANFVDVPDPKLTITPEPYIPESYILYAQGKGIEVPANVSPDVDREFRKFYDYIFYKQFKITNEDGSVTVGSLLNSSNPDLSIFIAPDGTPYVAGSALDNDPAFGEGNHFFILWDIKESTIATLTCPISLGVVTVGGYGDYTAMSPSGDIYRYNSGKNAWVLESQATPRTALTNLPSETPQPTSTAVSTHTPEAPTPEPTSALREGMSNFTFNTPDGESITITVRSEYLVVVDGENAANSFNIVGDPGSRVLYIGPDTALAYETTEGWVVDDTLHFLPDYIGLGPALTKHMLFERNDDLTALESHPGHVDIGAHDGFNIVAVYPAKLTALNVESVVYRDDEGNLTPTYMGNLSFAFNSGASTIRAGTFIYGIVYVSNRPVSLPDLVNEVKGPELWSLGFMTDYGKPVSKDSRVRNIGAAVNSNASAVRIAILNGDEDVHAWLGAIN